MEPAFPRNNGQKQAVGQVQWFTVFWNLMVNQYHLRCSSYLGESIRKKRLQSEMHTGILMGLTPGRLCEGMRDGKSHL